MDYQKKVQPIIDFIAKMEFEEKVKAINAVRLMLHEVSPFRNEPVDFVEWVPNPSVVANDYNPNKVAPPEMQLLEVSIMKDGYTQPIVTFQGTNNGKTREVVDGFHRTRVGKESLVIKQRVFGYVPIVSIRTENQAKADRIASTIRHNRARGKHQVSAMSEIVIDLKNRNWNNDRIARELGMDEDEILRLCQIAGLEDLFKDGDFSKSWDPADYTDENFDPLTDEVPDDLLDMYRIPNENDHERIFHTYDKWEHVGHNFFGNNHPTLTPLQCQYKYKEFLQDIPEFSSTIQRVMEAWPIACEHNLTNRSMNRIAWIGQISVCYKYNIPAISCSGFSLLTEDEQYAANSTALFYLNKWLRDHGIGEVSMDEACVIDRQVELY